MAAKNWCFTINNFSEEELQNTHDLEEHSQIQYLVFQCEEGEWGTPHIQGYVQLKNRKRLHQVKDIVSQRGHFEVARGTHLQNKAYCTKPENRLNGPWEYGTAVGGKGTRNDIKEFVEAYKQKPLNDVEIIDEFPNIMAKYPKFVSKLKHVLAGAECADPPFIPRDGWQCRLAARLLDRPDGRSITWIVDATGNTGKSTFARGFKGSDGGRGYIITGGKHTDIYYGYNYEKYIFFDLARTREDSVPYEVMENFKNGYFLSTKYEVRAVRFDIPHVVVFSNFEPDQSKLSADRWDIIRVTRLGEVRF